MELVFCIAGFNGLAQRASGCLALEDRVWFDIGFKFLKGRQNLEWGQCIYTLFIIIVNGESGYHLFYGDRTALSGKGGKTKKKIVKFLNLSK